MYVFLVSVFITYFCFATNLFRKNGEFLFLQFGFYTFFLSKINKNFIKIFQICLDFLNFKKEFVSVLDYFMINKDSDSDNVLNANVLTLMPGTIGILIRKKNLVVHSLDAKYFSSGNMWDLSQDIEKIDDDSLV